MSTANTGAVAPAATSTEAVSPIAGAAEGAKPVLSQAEAQSVATEAAEGAQLDAIEAAEDAGEISTKEAASLKKKLKLKVDGVDYEEEIDFADEDGLRKMMQKSKAFDSRAQKLSQLEAQLNRIAQMVEEDPEGFLEKAGKNMDEIAEKRLTRKIEEMKKSPEQLEKEKLIKERDELKAEADKIKKEKDEALSEQYKRQHAAAIEKDIKSVLDKSDTVLPKHNELILFRVGQAMNLAMANGRPDITAAEVFPYVENKYKQELASVAKDMTPAQLEAVFGKEVLENWRKDRIAKAKPQVPVAPTKVADTGKSTKSQESSSSEKKSYKDFFKLI